MAFTIHGILQARILEWVAFPFSRESSQPRDWTQVSCIAGGFFTSWAYDTDFFFYFKEFPDYCFICLFFSSPARRKVSLDCWNLWEKFTHIHCDIDSEQIKVSDLLK